MEKNWKDTLLMPKTNFEMRANLVVKEPKFSSWWAEKQIYQKALAKNLNSKKGSYILHDGPPYANGDIHIGHALNKILKDIVVRRKTMEGFYSPYIPGWDTHGLPIENKMLSDLKMTKDDLDQIVLRKKAKQYASKQIEKQLNQFQKLQLFSDFKEIYKTFDPSFEASQLKLFKKMALNKLIYKGLKPIYWSPSSQSALAEAEVEYADIRSPQIILSYLVTKGNDLVNPGDHLLVMTTTPWTVIATSGIAIGEKFKYSLIKINNHRFVVASALIEEVTKLCNWENYQIINEFSGAKLINILFRSPLNKLEAPIVAGHHVTLDMGTGLVQMAPLFGEDDYLIGKKNNLAMIMHVDNKGMINQEGGKYQNLFYENASKAVGQDLQKINQLWSLKFIKHSYPHDWRTHQPIIYRGVPQWFVNIRPIKEKILSELANIKSTPQWGVKRLAKMIETRDEWTISRQRTWGLPIIIFYDQDNQPVYNQEIFDYVIENVAQHGSDIWWEWSTDQLLPKQYRQKNWTREMDIMDVWFDSGSTAIAVKIAKEKVPYDLYLEGSDQYRGWFNSSIINSVAYYQKAPFKKLVSHGFVLDEKQQKMSKSKGNGVDPLKIINQNGADVLRLWVANSEYTNDVSISQAILKQNIEIYRRIRNTFKFMLGNLFDFDYAKNQQQLKGIHRYINCLIKDFGIKINNLYDNFKFVEIIKETNKLFLDLSSWYFDYAKDVLYCDQQNNIERRSIQTNIFEIINLTMLNLAPILPTTMEEIYQHFSKENKKISVFLETVDSIENQEKVDVKIDKFYREYRLLAYQLLEKGRQDNLIKRNNEAILTINIPLEDRIFTSEQLAKFLMVAEVKYGPNNVKAFNSKKCERCWNHFQPEQINENNLCPRCSKVVKY